eukprot:6245338-Amphidinium_carterae.1
MPVHRNGTSPLEQDGHLQSCYANSSDPSLRQVSSMSRQAYSTRVIMEAMIQAAQMPNLPPDDPVKEYVMSASERICSVLEEDFVRFLPHVLPGILAKLTTSSQECPHCYRDQFATRCCKLNSAFGRRWEPCKRSFLVTLDVGRCSVLFHQDGDGVGQKAEDDEVHLGFTRDGWELSIASTLKISRLVLAVPRAVNHRAIAPLCLVQLGPVQR